MKDAEDGVCESATGDGRRITCLLLQEDLAETERLLADNDQQGFYKHLKGTVGLGGRKARSEQFMDEDGTLPKDKVRIRERWGGFFQTRLNKKSPKLDPTISALFPQRPLTPSLGDEQCGIRPARSTIDMLFVVCRLQELCLLYTSPSPRDRQKSRMPSSA